MGKQTIDTQIIFETANKMSELNSKLSGKLDNCNELFLSLANSWSGQAYEESKAAFTSFCTKYKESYSDAINMYVEFLKKPVSEGYDETEKMNTGLSANFK